MYYKNVYEIGDIMKTIIDPGNDWLKFDGSTINLSEYPIYANNIPPVYTSDTLTKPTNSSISRCYKFGAKYVCMALITTGSVYYGYIYSAESLTGEWTLELTIWTMNTSYQYTNGYLLPTDLYKHDNYLYVVTFSGGSNYIQAVVHKIYWSGDNLAQTTFFKNASTSSNTYGGSFKLGNLIYYNGYFYAAQIGNVMAGPMCVVCFDSTAISSIGSYSVGYCTFLHLSEYVGKIFYWGGYSSGSMVYCYLYMYDLSTFLSGNPSGVQQWQTNITLSNGQSASGGYGCVVGNRFLFNLGNYNNSTMFLCSVDYTSTSSTVIQSSATGSRDYTFTFASISKDICYMSVNNVSGNFKPGGQTSATLITWLVNTDSVLSGNLSSLEVVSTSDQILEGMWYNMVLKDQTHALNVGMHKNNILPNIDYTWMKIA